MKSFIQKGSKHRALRVAGALSIACASVLPLWGCVDDEIIGTDTIADDEHFFPPRPDKPTGDGGPVTDNGRGCDLSGRWMAVLQAPSTALRLTAVSYNTFYYEIENDENGKPFIARGQDCGIQVCKVSEVQLTRNVAETLSQYNRQDGRLRALEGQPELDITVEPRKITMTDNRDGTCTFELERWWWLRGAPMEYYPPREEYEELDMASIKAKYPMEEFIGKGLVDLDNPPPELDWDKDGKAGYLLSVSKPVNGWRSVVQRDWNKAGPWRISAGQNEFVVPGDFDNEEIRYGALPVILDQASTANREASAWRFVRVDDAAPVDTAGFYDYCQEKTAELFKSGPNNCPMTELVRPTE